MTTGAAVSKKYTASARVTISLEMEHDSSYGTGCSIDQIHAQASRETQQKLESLLRDQKVKGFSVRVDQVNVRIRETEP